MKIQHTTGAPRLGTTPKVQTIVEGKIVDVLEAAEMNKEIQVKTKMRFDLAHSAAVTRLSLRSLVGYCANTDFAHDLVQGKVPIPKDTDSSTDTLIRECQLFSKAAAHPQTSRNYTRQLLLLLGAGTREHLVSNIDSLFWALESNDKR